MCAKYFESYSSYHLFLGFSGLNLRTTSCLNWRRWWMTLELQHQNKEVLQIPTWSQFHLKIWRRESWRLWKDTMGRFPAKVVCFHMTVVVGTRHGGLHFSSPFLLQRHMFYIVITVSSCFPSRKCYSTVEYIIFGQLNHFLGLKVHFSNLYNIWCCWGHVLLF